jgi:hypothetical protein
VSRMTPPSERTPALRNAFTNPKTRLSPIRCRTRPTRAVWSSSRPGARCRPFGRPVSPGRSPNRTCTSPRIRLSPNPCLEPKAPGRRPGRDPQYPHRRTLRRLGAPVFTGNLLPFPSVPAGSLPPFAMWTAFPPSDYYEGSATPVAISRRRACPEGRPRTLPTFTTNRSTREVSSWTPAASPHLRRRHSVRPPGRRDRPASESPVHGRALQTGPDPPGSSRRFAYGALPLVPLVHLLVSLAGPGPSGSTGPSRRCQGCSRPPLRLQDQAALSFTGLLRQPEGGALSSPPG